MMKLKTVARDPLAWMLGALGGVAAFLNAHLLHSLWAALWASSGDLFTLVSLGALTLPPHVPPENPVDWVVIGVGGLFLFRIGLRVYERFDMRI
jgi:hypothetical protein